MTEINNIKEKYKKEVFEAMKKAYENILSIDVLEYNKYWYFEHLNKAIDEAYKLGKFETKLSRFIQDVEDN